MRFDLWQEERARAKILSTGLKVLCEHTNTDRPILKIWKPKATKPYIHYYFKSIKARAEYIKKAIDSHKQHLKSKEEYKQQRQVSPEVSKTLKRGDIFITSWGYDQTNYDYIAIISISSTGKTAKCQRTSSLHMGESGQSNVQEPIFSPFGDTFTMQIRSGYGGGVSLVGSYPFCHDGTGSKRKGYFSQHTAGHQYQETMSQFGH